MWPAAPRPEALLDALIKLQGKGEHGAVAPRAPTACCASCWNWTAKSSPSATPDIGYLHRGDEKIAENMTYNQFVPYTDRLDYLAPLANNVAYALASKNSWAGPSRRAARSSASSAANWPASPRICSAWARWPWIVGAMTVFLYIFTEREKIYNLIELLTGARFTTSYTRIGGQIARPAARLRARRRLITV
jgi:hypothetical protein